VSPSETLRRAAFLLKYGEKIRANEEYNLSVNTRQVRRYYARIMAKREARA